MNNMEFFKENAVWLTPVLVAVCGGIISGIFYLIKKGGNHQHIGNVGGGSVVNQINGNNTVVNGNK